MEDVNVCRLMDAVALRRVATFIFEELYTVTCLGTTFFAVLFSNNESSLLLDWVLHFLCPAHQI